MLLVLMLMVNAVVGYDQSVNYWQAFAPGKLLQRLDALTSSTDQLYDLPRAQAKLDEVADSIEATDVDADDDDDVEQADGSHSVEAHSGEDYERNYEQFVREYFDRADDPDDAAEEQSVETQAEASNLQPAKKRKLSKEDKVKEKDQQQRCRHIKRHGQLCKICKEARNNEVSETCSYSHEQEPERYAYGSGTKYKRYRDDYDDEDDKPTKRRRERQTKRDMEPIPNSSSSLCERRLVGKSVCYECKDNVGQHLKRCYDTKTNKLSSSNMKQPNGRETAKKEQRIYKRTISYSYQEHDNDNDDTEMTTATAPTTSTPSVINRRLARIVRRRVAIPAANTV